MNGFNKSQITYNFQPLHTVAVCGNCSYVQWLRLSLRHKRVNVNSNVFVSGVFNSLGLHGVPEIDMFILFIGRDFSSCVVTGSARG